MLKNYFQVALRSLKKNKSYVVINTLGLGIALACCITAYLLLAYNIEFDSFHKDEKVNDIYKVITHFDETTRPIKMAMATPIVLPPIAAEDIAGIKQFTRCIYGGGFMRYEEKSFSEGSILFADSTFFDFFDFPLITGSYGSFKNKYSIYLSKAMATKYFGDDDPIGKLLIMNFPNNKEMEVIVGGIVDKVPLNSSFVFDAVMRIENYLDIYDLQIDSWEDWRDPTTFFKIDKGANVTEIGKQFNKYIRIRNEAKPDVTVSSYELVPFKEKYTEEDVGFRNVNLRIPAVPIILFTSMAVMILLIACFNLTNTSIAMTSKRLKEVGVRKSVGAARQQIVFQFLFETVLAITMALIVGLLLSQLIVPVFTEMWGLQYGMEDLNGINLFIALVFIVFVASLLAGIYPALFNSRFNPVSLLKGSVKIKGTNGLTRTLIAIQFAISVIVLIAGVMFIRNAQYQNKIKFGYDKEGVITVNIQSNREFEAMESKIISNPKILSVAVSDHQVGMSTYTFPVHIDTTEYQAQLIGVGKNYIETLGFNMNQGRSFNLDNASDLKEAVIVNRAFLEKVKMEDPIDKVITVHSNKRRIVGVIENHIDNLYRSKEPEAFVFYPALESDMKIMSVKVNPSQRAEMQQYLEKTWKELFPSKPFLSRFQDDIMMQRTNEINSNLERIFLFLTVLGGLLSSSGIFALASLNIAKRTKEIGIRKALGASVVNVVALLNKEFIIILFIAGILGSVGGYFGVDWILGEIYAYRIPVGIISVILCALGIILIGMLTTSTTIFKAAKSNPVDTLRNE